MASIADIILAQGQSAANARRRSGERSAQMWTNLADIVGTTAQTWAREREEAPLRKMQTEAAQLNLDTAKATAADRDAERQVAAQLRELFAGPGMPDPRAIVSIVGPERGLRIVEGLNALQPDPRQEFEDTQKILRDTIRGLDALPEENRAEYYPTVRANMVQRGVIKPEDAPEEYDPNWWASTRQYGEAPKTAEPFTLSPGQQRFGADGQPIAAVPEEEKPDTRSLQLQLADAIRRGDREGMNAIRQAIRQAAEAERAPEKPEDPLARRERELRVAKLEADLVKAVSGSENEKLDAIRPVLGEIASLVPRIFTQRGPVANITGSVRSAMAAANMDNDVRLYRSLVRGMTPLLARAVGHTGMLTEQDVNRTEELFPSISFFGGADNKDVAAQKIEQFERMMAGHGSSAEKQEIREFMGWGTSAPTTDAPRGRGPGPVGGARTIGRFEVLD